MTPLISKNLLRNILVSLTALILVLILFELTLAFTAPSNEPTLSKVDLELENKKVCRFGKNFSSNDPIEIQSKQFFDQGKGLMSNGDFNNAITNFENAIKLKQNVAEIYVKKAKAHFAIGEYQDAIKNAEKAIELCNTDYEAFTVLGEVYFALGTETYLNTKDPHQAEQTIERGAIFFSRAEDLKPNSALLPLCAFKDDNTLDYALLENHNTFHITKRDTYSVIINSIGLREANQINQEKASDSIRVFFIGDSYVFGFGVQEKNSIPFLVEEKFAQASFGRKVEVLNLGVPGYDLYRENILFDKYSHLNPDAVLIGINGTDFQTTGKPGEDCIGVTKNGCLFNYGKCEKPLDREKFFLQEYLGWSKTYNFFKEKIQAINSLNKDWEKVETHLKQLVEKIKGKNAKPIIVFIPLKEITTNEQLSGQKFKILEEFAKKENIQIINPSEAIVKNNVISPQYFDIIDDHTNASGNETIAQEIVNNLEVFN